MPARAVWDRDVQLNVSENSVGQESVQSNASENSVRQASGVKCQPVKCGTRMWSQMPARAVWDRHVSSSTSESSVGRRAAGARQLWQNTLQGTTQRGLGIGDVSLGALLHMEQRMLAWKGVTT
eukprot:349702-Chlamydomonas_euryale.AAC.4